MATSKAITLLSNASATGSGVPFPGGPAVFEAVGTFGTNTVTLQYLASDGSTYIDVVNDAGTTAALTAGGMHVVQLPPCTVRAEVAGGAGSSGLYVELAGIA